MVVVGIDSAPELTGIAVLDDGRLVKSGAVKIGGWADVERVAARLESYKPAIVAVEDAFCRVSDGTGLVLAKLVGRWTQALEARGIRCVEVLASEWQPKVLPISYRAKRAERKAAAQALVLERFGRSVSDDVGDAICIALWAGENASKDPAGGTGQVPSQHPGAGSRVSSTEAQRADAGAPEIGSIWQSPGPRQEGTP